MEIDIKTIKKIAAACRKAGIRTFKGYGVEFTLEDVPSPSQPKYSKKSPITDNADSIESDVLSESDLLFWSVGDVPSAQASSEE